MSYQLLMSEDLSRLSNESIINEITLNEQRNLYLRRELQRRNDDRIEQLQLLVQRLSVRGGHIETSSQVAEERAREENTANRVELEIDTEPEPESESESEDEINIVTYPDDISIRVRPTQFEREDGTVYQIPIVIPNTSLEGRGTNHNAGSRRYIPYGSHIGLRDNRDNGLISGTIVELLSQSGPSTPFAGQRYAIVVGLSQYGQRVLIAKIQDRNRTTDRVATNVLGPTPVEIELE